MKHYYMDGIERDHICRILDLRAVFLFQQAVNPHHRELVSFLIDIIQTTGDGDNAHLVQETLTKLKVWRVL